MKCVCRMWPNWQSILEKSMHSFLFLFSGQECIFDIVSAPCFVLLGLYRQAAVFHWSGQTHCWGTKHDGQVPFSLALGAQNGLPDNLHRSFPLRSGPALRGVGSWILQPAMKWASLMGYDLVRPDDLFHQKRKNHFASRNYQRVQNQIFYPLKFTKLVIFLPDSIQPWFCLMWQWFYLYSWSHIPHGHMPLLSFSFAWGTSVWLVAWAVRSATPGLILVPAVFPCTMHGMGNLPS
jgi:hypothetical protein